MSPAWPYAAAMLSAMATGTIRHRRLIHGMGVGLAAACAWIGLRMPPTSAVGFVVVLLPMPLALTSWVLGVVAMSRPRPAMLVVDSGISAFRTLPDARLVYLAIGSALMSAVGPGTGIEGAERATARGDPDLPFMIGAAAVMVGLWVVAAALWAVRVWSDVPHVQLRRDGLVARSPLGTLTVPWEAMAPGYPRLAWGGGLMLSYARPDLVRRHGLMFGGRQISAEGVDPRFLGAAIAYYVAYPQCRAEIGTQAGYDRLRWTLTGQPSSAPYA